MPATRADVARRLNGYRMAGASYRTGGIQPRSAWSYLLGETPPTNTVLPATEAEALAMPPFGRGVALLANAVASTSWHAARWDAALGVSVKIPDQPAVVTNPFPNTTPWNYRWAATEDGILYGNHFALYGDPDSSNSYWPKFLVPIPADQVWVLSNPETGAWSWTWNGSEISPADLLHVPYGNRSGEILGRGVLYQYAMTLGGYVAAEDHAGAYFAGGALPPAVLQSPTVLTQTQAADLKTSWRAMTSTREPVILPMGYVLTPVVSTAVEAQLVEARTWNASLVAMMLGIPPWKLGLAGPTMTYQNVETADIDFIRDSADRYGAPLAAAFTKYLVPAGNTVVFDYAGRMRADQSTTATVLTAYTGAGILTKDEARATIGRPPLTTTDTIGSTPQGVPELTPSEVIPSE
jgi:HK97 family phage portal protein